MELAYILKKYGAVDAMNMDGGGSTSMAVDGISVNNPGNDGVERPVADMLLVNSSRPEIPIPEWGAKIPSLPIDLP